MANYVHIFDTTLRDGEQSPGCSMNVQEKLQVARVLDELGVDVIEAGFPAASDGDFESVKSVGELGLNATICGLSRTRHGDIEAVARSLDTAENKRLHVFIATSPIHREYKLKMGRQQIIDEMLSAMEFGQQWFDDIEVTAEDAGRTEIEYLVEYFQAAVDAGARVLNVPDTVGYVTPGESRKLYQHLSDKLRNMLNPSSSAATTTTTWDWPWPTAWAPSKAERTAGGVHDQRNWRTGRQLLAGGSRDGAEARGMTVTNSKPESTRPGSIPASRVVTAVTGSRVQPNKAIVGRNAFAHEAGIHQDGVCSRHAETYEIMKPETVGVPENSAGAGQTQRPPCVQ